MGLEVQLSGKAFVSMHEALSFMLSTSKKPKNKKTTKQQQKEN
jgi:hypothetical protein